MRDLIAFTSSTVAPMIGDDAAENLTQLLKKRRDLIEREVEAIAAQYPVYAAELEKTLVMRAALRRERQQYIRLFNDAVIEREILESLEADLDARERMAAKPPRLDLTYAPLGLLDRVPIFAGLDAKQRQRLARAMKTRFLIPGEMAQRIGERSEEITFVASGALERRRADGEVVSVIGSGDVFGAVALTDPHQRRRVDIEAIGYCRLLVLRRKDLVRLGRRDPTIQSLIASIAKRSPGAGPGEAPAADAAPVT